MKTTTINCCGKRLTLGAKPVIMGILNVTPDSFSDGGQFNATDKAIEHGLQMVADGAGIIDIGGESTRPGSEPVSAAEQILRVVPVISALAAKVNVPISIDTMSSEVAAAAIEAGAGIINDVAALRYDDKLAGVAAETGAAVVLMHMLGEPRSMQQNPTYVDVVKEVKDFLAERIEYAVACGIERGQIMIDPGIGFGKTVEHNLLLMREIGQFHELGCPVLMGTSRKAFIGRVLGKETPAERMWGTAATVGWSVSCGAQIVRVHDVKEMAEVAKMTAAMRDGEV